MTESYDVAQQPTRRVGMGLPLGLAAAGVGGGLIANKIATKPMSHDDIIKEMAPDKIDIHTKGDNGATWKEAQELAEKVQKAKKAFDDASKPTLAKDAKARVDYEAVEKEVQNAIARKDAEFEKMAQNTAGGEIKLDKIKKFSEIASTDLPTVHPDSGKAFKGDALEKEYNGAVKALEDAKNALDTKLDTGLRHEKQTKISEIEKMITDTMSDLAGKDEADIADYFGDKIRRRGVSDQYQRAIDIAEKAYTLPTNLTDEQILQFATKVEKGETAPIGRKIVSKTLSVKNEHGRFESIPVWYKEGDYNDALKTLQEAVDEQRTKCADELFNELSTSCRINREIAGLETKVGKEVSADLAKETGLFNTVSDTLDISRIISDGKLTGGKNRYSDDISKLQKAINDAKKAGVAAPTVDAAIASQYGLSDTMSASDAVKQLTARNQVYKQYNKELNGLNEQLRLSKENNPIIKEYNEKIQEVIANDKDVNKATTKLHKWFPKLFPEHEASTTPKKATIDDIGSTLKAKYENLKKTFEEAAKKDGAVDEKAKQAAKDALDKEQQAFDKVVDKLGGEGKVMKMFGGKKWVAPVIGAVVLALVGLGIRNSKNKENA